MPNAHSLERSNVDGGEQLRGIEAASRLTTVSRPVMVPVERHSRPRSSLYSSLIPDSFHINDHDHSDLSDVLIFHFSHFC